MQEDVAQAIFDGLLELVNGTSSPPQSIGCRSVVERVEPVWTTEDELRAEAMESGEWQDADEELVDRYLRLLERNPAKAAKLLRKIRAAQDRALHPGSAPGGNRATRRGQADTSGKRRGRRRLRDNEGGLP